MVVTGAEDGFEEPRACLNVDLLRLKGASSGAEPELCSKIWVGCIPTQDAL